MPVGVELLGRALDDARLLGFAYALEQATDQRRAPLTTPALVGGAAPGPLMTTVNVGGPASRVAEAEARFEYDPVLGTLAYDVLISGVSASDVYALVLRHADEQGRWSVAARLTGPGVTADRGTLALDEQMRARLERGALYLELSTRDAPFGTARSQVLLGPR
jgi:hypothetical protein